MGIIYHKGVPYASGTINEETPYGTSAPSGGSDGDLYVQIDNNGNIIKVWQNHNNTWGYLSGGETYTAGTNISIDNNVISAIDTNEVSGLNDVEITNLDDGQVLKWDGTNEKWVNDDEAGGLTPVEMDYEDWLELPQEEREDPNVEYFLSNAPSGGGGSGYSETTLWENTSGLSFNGNNQQIVTLSDNISNYDLLCLIYTDNLYTTSRAMSTYPISEIDTSGAIGFWLNPLVPENNLNSPRSVYVSDNQIKLIGVTARVTMVAYKIIGIKFGGGGSSSEINYSTEEQEIGTWIDGKPLYQITKKIVNDELWADFTYYGLGGVGDIDFATVKEATFVDQSNSVYASLPYRIPSTNNYIEVSMNTIDSVKRLTIRTNTTFSATTGRYIVATIIYTKTTD